MFDQLHTTQTTSHAPLHTGLNMQLLPSDWWSLVTTFLTHLTEFYFSLFGEISQTGHRCCTFTNMILHTWITLLNVFIWDRKVGIILGFPIMLTKNELTGYLISIAGKKTRICGSCFFGNWRFFSFTGGNWKLDAFRLTGVLWIITSHCTQYFLDVYSVIKYTKLKWIRKCLRSSLRKIS